MEKIAVEFLSALSSFTNERRVELELPEGSSIATVLAALHQRYGNKGTERIFNHPRGLSPALVMMVNGVDIRYMDGIDTIVKEGDVVVCLPIIMGG
nr:MoaD/ThiS family protein [Candidatus Sigynarchaeota archaeon]